MSDAPIFTRDPLVANVLTKMAKRAEDGRKTYGDTMEQATKPFDKWIEDTQEELMDAVVYLEKVKQDYRAALTKVKKSK